MDGDVEPTLDLPLLVDACNRESATGELELDRDVEPTLDLPLLVDAWDATATVCGIDACDAEGTSDVIVLADRDVVRFGFGFVLVFT